MQVAAVYGSVAVFWCQGGCVGHHFNATRDTVTYEILETYKIGEKPQFTAKASGEKV